MCRRPHRWPALSCSWLDAWDASTCSCCAHVPPPVVQNTGCACAVRWWAPTVQTMRNVQYDRQLIPHLASMFLLPSGDQLPWIFHQFKNGETASRKRPFHRLQTERGHSTVDCTGCSLGGQCNIAGHGALRKLVVSTAKSSICLRSFVGKVRVVGSI